MSEPAGDAIAIRCVDLSRRYGEVEALRSLDLEIAQGTIFGFLGRNGAGKTTTIRLLTGLARPTSGSAWVSGMETTGADNVAREVFGYLPQDPAFYNWLTPTEYLGYVGRLFAMEPSRRERRVAEVLALVALEDAANRRIGGFSGGMIQRLGIAQALLHEPPVLFLDEPTSSLDPAGRHAVLDLIRQLRGKVTVFLSSHILGDVERVCDTIGIIHEGRLLLVANRDELLERYARNIIFLEADRDSVAKLDDFTAVIAQLPWVLGVDRDGATLRITVSSLVEAKEALLPLVVARDIVLLRYEWVRPSLEEVFLSISS